MDCKGGLGAPVRFRSSAIWTSDTKVMGSKRSQPHCPQKKSRQTLGLPMFKHCISYQ
jgi:hypothetical protein